MIQVLSNVLRCPSASRIRESDDPCWIVQHSGHDNDNGTAGDQILTYQAARLSVHQHQRALRTALASIAGRDITIAYLGTNSMDYALSLLAASNLAVTRRRATSVYPRSIRPALLNTRWSAAEMVAALQPAESVLILFSSNLQETATKLRDQLRRQQSRPTMAMMTEIAMMPLPTFGVRNLTPISSSSSVTDTSISSYSNSQTHNRNDDICTAISQLAQSASDDDAVLVFTSGTTSKTAKGVRLSHRALLVQAAAKLALPCAYQAHTRLLATTVPLFHVGGLSSFLAVCMAGGALVEPATNHQQGEGSFSPPSVYQALVHSTYPCNTLVVVPAMVHALLQHDASTKPMPHVDLILVGGQSLSTRQGTFLRQTFPAARIVQTFACTEAASSLTFLDVTTTTATTSKARDVASPHRQLAPPGVCVGKPPSHVQIQLLDAESLLSNNNDQETAIVTRPYQVGLIATRGPHVMSGYWGMPLGTETNYNSNDGRYFPLSDFGYWDESGQLYFCGRQTDTIRTGGETVWATEVEQVLAGHELVDQVAVVGLVDDQWGEVVACAVVPRRNNSSNNNAGVTLTELRAWCKSKGLASYKQPKRLVILSSDLPRNSSGKILKHRIKDCFENSPPSRL